MAVNPHCKEYTLDFVVKEGDTEIAVIEDDIKKDLAKIGIKVNSRFVSETDYIKIEENGDYNLFFTRSWGAPYDPHTYLNSWSTPAHVEYSSTGNLDPPLTREILLVRIESVQRELDEDKIKSQWKDILSDIHQQALFLPLWGARVPYVLNRQLAGFTPSSQTYTYPIESIRILNGSKNVSIAPMVLEVSSFLLQDQFILICTFQTSCLLKLGSMKVWYLMGKMVTFYQPWLKIGQQKVCQQASVSLSLFEKMFFFMTASSSTVQLPS